MSTLAISCKTLDSTGTTAVTISVTEDIFEVTTKALEHIFPDEFLDASIEDSGAYDEIEAVSDKPAISITMILSAAMTEKLIKDMAACFGEEIPCSILNRQINYN